MKVTANTLDYLGMNCKTELESWGDVGNYISQFKVSSSLVNNSFRAMSEHNADFSDAFSKGQLASKHWLVDNLNNHGLLNDEWTYLVCGGWYAVLPSIMFSESNEQLNITSIDIDPLCEPVANAINAEQFFNGYFSAYTQDMYNNDYDAYDVVINTSCEHIPNFEEWFSLIEPGTYFVLQSNDFLSGNGHINCVTHVSQIYRDIPYSKLIYTGTLRLPNYNRFLVIGVR